MWGKFKYAVLVENAMAAILSSQNMGDVQATMDRLLVKITVGDTQCSYEYACSGKDRHVDHFELQKSNRKLKYVVFMLG